MRSIVQTVIFAITLAIFTPAHADEEMSMVDVNRWMQTYYIHKKAENSYQALDMLLQNNAFSESRNIAPSIGFFSQFFNKNPDVAKKWLENAEIGESQAETIVRILVIAGMEEEAKVLITKNNWTSLEQNIASYAANIRAIAPSPRTIDLWWGAFFATGDVDFIKNVINVLGDKDDGPHVPISKAAARWSLGTNAIYHQTVRDILVTELKSTKNEMLAEQLQLIHDELQPELEKHEELRKKALSGENVGN